MDAERRVWRRSWGSGEAKGVRGRGLKVAGNRGMGAELGSWPRSVMRGLVENKGQVGSEESKLETLSLPTV